MAGVRAAGLNRAELSEIRARDPDAASEITLLNQRIIEGSDGPGDLIRFIRLVFIAGNKETSEEMLRAAIVAKDDEFFRLYVELFGQSPEDLLEPAIRDYARRFGVVLHNPRRTRFLQFEYSATVSKASSLRRLLRIRTTRSTLWNSRRTASLGT